LLERRLAQHVRDFLRRTYDLDLAKIVIEQPPKVELGEYAMPLAFELAKKLRKPPRKIAEEIVNGIGPIDGFGKLLRNENRVGMRTPVIVRLPGFVPSTGRGSLE
jgi:arginyl-tRNA synthetase